MSQQPNSGWRNWGDHPLVVIVGLIVAFISIFAFFTGKDKIQDLFSRDNTTPVAQSSDLPAKLVEHMTLGQKYYDEGKYELAIIEMTQAINVKPDHAEAYNIRGSSYAKLDKSDNAIIDFDQAIKYGPDHAEYYNNKGYTYNQAKRYQEAIDVLKMAISKNPGYEASYVNIAVSYQNIGDDNNAISNFRRCSELTTDEKTKRFCDEKEYELLAKRLNK